MDYIRISKGVCTAMNKNTDDVLLRPLRNKPFISFAIPSSIISEAPDLREKTRKIGYVGRAAAIFRVEEILIYKR